jgi:hypothetical protein
LVYATEQLNAARGRLRSIPHHGLLTRANEVARGGHYACKEKTIFNYLKEMNRSEVLPLEQPVYSRVSLDTIAAAE